MQETTIWYNVKGQDSLHVTINKLIESGVVIQQVIPTLQKTLTLGDYSSQELAIAIIIHTKKEKQS